MKTYAEFVQSLKGPALRESLFPQWLKRPKLHNTFGYLHPDGKVSPAKEEDHDHDALAQRLGYKNTNHALKNGLIRYFHNHEPDNERSYKKKTAGYEFTDSRRAREHVAQHLASTRGFNHIWLDHRHPKTGQITSHDFNSVEAAQKHLDERYQGQVRYSWVEHPKHGKLYRRGDFEHQKIMDDHEIDAHRDNPARGQFVIDHDKKRTIFHHYKGSGKLNDPFIGVDLRHELKIPKSYTHRTVTA